MKKIRFGIIGTNFITGWILEASREEPCFEAVAVYSRQKDTGEAFALKYAIPHVFTSLEEMACSPLIDAVYVASPNALHASQSITFMNQGKHVLCEKPMASNATELKEMIAASRRNKVTLMEAMKSTLTPNFSRIKEALPRLGAIRRYFASYCQYSSRYDQLKAGTVLNAFKPELSNGAMMDLGIYTVYPMVVLFGRPEKISATSLLLSTGVDGQGAVNFEYPGMNATILYSKIADSFLPAEIQGEAGTLTLDRIHTISKVTLLPKGGQPEDLTVTPEHHEYYYELAEFVRLVQNREHESSVNSHAHSLITLEIIDEIRRQSGIVYPADHQPVGKQTYDQN